MKKRSLLLAVALLLVVACCVPVSASEEAIGDMGTCDIYNANNVCLGEGGLWNDSLYEYTLGGYISAMELSGLKMTLDMDYIHYSTGEDLYMEGVFEGCYVSSLSDSIYLSPNEGTPYYGFGDFNINGFFNAIGDEWP